MKEREIVKTKDGSHTIYVPELNEHYHSSYGAIQESRHIYIENAFKKIDKSYIKVLEVGFGTGLNCLLTALDAKKTNKAVTYFGVEKYPLDNEEIGRIPLLAFDTAGDPMAIDTIIKPDMIPYVVNGIYNPNFLTQKETAEFLILYYNHFVSFNHNNWDVDENASALEDSVRNVIVSALLEAEEDDVVVRETTLLQTGEPVDGRAIILMVDPDTNEELPLSKAITTRRQWENAKALRDAIGGVQVN